MNVLILVDFQNDFVLKNAPLEVSGATRDIFNVSRFLNQNKGKIKKVIATLDFHNHCHVSHACNWENQNGEHPAPFTKITLADIKNKVWRYLDTDCLVETYLSLIEQKGRVHTIWPEHCIAGTQGANLHAEILEAIYDYETTQHRPVTFLLKGMSSDFEQHSAFSKINTLVNTVELNPCIAEEVNFYVAGEAYSHCVKDTVEDMLKSGIKPQNITVLSNCTSSIAGFDMTEWENSMKERSMNFKETTEVTL